MTTKFVDNKIELCVDGKFIHIGCEERNGVPVFTVRALEGSLIILPDFTNQIAMLVSL